MPAPLDHLKTLFTRTLHARQTPEERELFQAFAAHQAQGSKALFVFSGLTGSGVSYLGTHSDCGDIRAHMEWNMEQDPFLYHTLLAALDTGRSLKAQWPYKQGTITCMTTQLAERPLITAPQMS